MYSAVANFITLNLEQYAMHSMIRGPDLTIQLSICILVNIFGF